MKLIIPILMLTIIIVGAGPAIVEILNGSNAWLTLTLYAPNLIIMLLVLWAINLVRNALK